MKPHLDFRWSWPARRNTRSKRPKIWGTLSTYYICHMFSQLTSLILIKDKKNHCDYKSGSSMYIIDSYNLSLYFQKYQNQIGTSMLFWGRNRDINNSHRKIGAITSVIVESIFIRTWSEGPAVSLNGSPTLQNE